jgi:hypothetical protein
MPETDNTSADSGAQDPVQSERFSHLLHRIQEHANLGGLTLRQLLEVFGPKGHVFLTIFLVLPFLQPIPIPGLSTLLGLAIAWVGYFMMVGQAPWLPERLAKIHVQQFVLKNICSGLERWMKRIEPWIRPRESKAFSRILNRGTGRETLRRVNGAILCFHALVLSLPLPIPFSNFFPAVVLFLVALGTLEEDAYVLIAGYCVVAVNAAFFAALIAIPFV